MLKMNTISYDDLDLDVFAGCLRVGPIQGTVESFCKALRKNELSVGHLDDEIEIELTSDGYIEFRCDSANGALFDEFGLEAHPEVIEDFLLDYLDEDETITFSGCSLSDEERLLHKITTYRRTGDNIRTSSTEKNTPQTDSVPIWRESDLLPHAYVKDFPFEQVAANDNIIPFPIARRR